VKNQYLEKSYDKRSKNDALPVSAFEVCMCSLKSVDFCLDSGVHFTWRTILRVTLKKKKEISNGYSQNQILRFSNGLFIPLWVC
jgi:hypothetical protein